MPAQLVRRDLLARWMYPIAGAAFVACFSVVPLYLDGPLRAGSLALAFLVAMLTGLFLARRDCEMRKLMVIDPLTRLPNRRHFEQALSHELANAYRSSQPLALLVVDVDQLKTINDKRGHHAGDAAIQLVADALRGTCRLGDVCARWGGDEFVVLAPRTDTLPAQALLERIRAAIPRHAVSRGQAPVTASVGFAIASVDQPSSLRPGALFAAADKAMYRRKCVRQKSPPPLDASTLAPTPGFNASSPETA